MAAAMADRDRMVPGHSVQILARERAVFGGLGVIVLEAQDPLTSRRLRRALGNGGLNLGDGTKVAIDFP